MHTTSIKIETYVRENCVCTQFVYPLHTANAIIEIIHQELIFTLFCTDNFGFVQKLRNTKQQASIFCRFSAH